MFVWSDNPSISLEYFLLAAVIVIVPISFLLICFKINTLFRSRRKFATDVSQWIVISFYISSICFVSFFKGTYQRQCVCISEWIWRTGAIAVFLGWTTITIDLKRFPFTGIIINMLSSITLTFVKLIPIAILLIFTFALPFYMLLAIPVSDFANR